MPMSIPVHGILTAQRREANGSPWVFPAATGDGALVDPRKALEKVSEYIGVRFTSHTLRHTFGSIAFERTSLGYHTEKTSQPIFPR